MSERTYCLITFGCQMNEADSERIDGILLANGWRKIDSENDADLVLFNTCVVRQGAEDRALARLARLKPLKRANPEKLVAICGCLAQQDGRRLLETMPWVDLVLGTRALPRLAPLLDEAIATGAPQVCVDLDGDPCEIPDPPRRAPDLVARVNIILGCNKNCSYCVVPTTRGRELSRPWPKILEEVRVAAAGGRKEVLLIGQNVNSYRDGEVRLPELMAKVDAVPGVERIRTITSHPRDAGEGQFRAMAELPRVCESLHLPAQSGSTRVLRRMYRGYSRERYLKKVEQLRSFVPDATLTTDLIAGFPGETDEDFEQTLSLVREARFDSAFMFLYSPRRGTAAAQWPDDVPLEVKKERLARLIDLQEAISREKNRALEGRRFEVLVERSAKRPAGHLSGRTRGDKTVVFPGGMEMVGKTIKVEIVDSNGHTLFGRMA
ncbi:MAG: tRNA (N6-isopentenyl adenosine(37)-C2)-methylthiotransferase MiaB [Candidatus Sumerlaeota bacterium]|nr:tRNA (N6-isopentenyl adenosine(37)-C2)-methylthiotransferase MiaB [Candidatus Sumerlaeota bacterium]